MKEQMSSRKYESSSVSYHSTFFTMEKKDGALRVVHDLQPLNAVTVRDAMLPPRVDNMIKSFTGHTVYGLFNLKSRYNSRILATISRDLTSFFVEGMGLLRLTRLPQGHTNLVAEFQRCTQHMIGPMYPEQAEVFIDDCAIKGPKTRYTEGTIPNNEQIRQFVWEYAHIMQELLVRVQESGVTVSGSKMVLATPRLQLLGAEVALDEVHVLHKITAKLAKWPTCRNPTEVRGFLGTVGVVRCWIWDFAKIAKPLTALTKKMAPHKFEWTNEAQDAMELLKHLATMAVPVRSLDYELACRVKPVDQRDGELGLVTVHVDLSTIGVGWMIAQRLVHTEYPIVFGSITFNEREAHYSQPKLELYGVFRVLKVECHRLHNIHFRLIVDAGFLAQMMTSPDLPNAAMTRWITYIQLFTFEINHTPGIAHRVPDGLSRQPRAADDSDYSDGDIDVEDGIKLVKASSVEFNNIDYEERELEESLHVHEILSESKLKCLLGEVKALECQWAHPEVLMYDHRRMYAGIGEEIDLEEESEKLTHEHRIPDKDGEEYWDEILVFLHLKRLPSSPSEALKVQRRSKCFFILDGVLWHKNGNKPPLLVILSPEVRTRIARDAHDNTGHRGWDPTFQ